MRLPKSVRERFRTYGRAGGRARAARMSPEARSAVASRAAIRRWIQVRFGAARFAELGLPGAAIVDAGLDDLAAHRETIESLAVSEAAPRLRREGVPVPRHVRPGAAARLYRRLEQRDHALAHARFNAHLRQLVSFADACAAVRESRVPRA